MKNNDQEVTNTMVENFNFKKLDPNIFVYKDQFKNLDNLLLFLKKQEWSPWYSFGEIYKLIKDGGFSSDTFPSSKEWKHYLELSKISDEESEIFNVFYNLTKHYMTLLGISFDNYLCSQIDVCKYYDANNNPNKTKHSALYENNSLYTMHFHTDYPQESIGAPGNKQMVTCNMYLNDNYDDGDIEFKVFLNDGSYKRITYKPEAGDVVIFPSKPPYWHGVKETINGEKQFVRSFWYVTETGSDEWIANEKKFGSDIWKKMEEERKTFEVHSGKHIRDDK